MPENSINLPIFDIVKSAWRKVYGSVATFWAVFICYFIFALASYCLELFVKENITVLHQLLAQHLHLPQDTSFSIVTMFTQMPPDMKWTAIGVATACTIVFLFVTLTRILLLSSLGYLSIQRAMDAPIKFKMIGHIFNRMMMSKLIRLIILSIILIGIPAGILIYLPPYLLTFYPDSDTASLARLLIAISYMVGLILITYLETRMLLAPAFIMVNKSNPWAAIKASFKSTKSHVLKLIGLLIINYLIIGISGMLSFGIALIWTLPYLCITYGEVYKRLVTSHETVS